MAIQGTLASLLLVLAGSYFPMVTPGHWRNYVLAISMSRARQAAPRFLARWRLGSRGTPLILGALCCLWSLPALAQERPYTVEPFLGAGIFTSIINIDRSPVLGLRVRTPNFFYAEVQGGRTTERPPEGCANEFCHERQGPVTLLLWSVGTTWDVLASSPRARSGLEVAAGLGQVRLTTHRANRDPHTLGPPALALSVAGRYRLNEQMMVRLSAGNYFGLRSVPHQAYTVALSSHATVRVGVELAF